jgi:hypothetical protein
VIEEWSLVGHVGVSEPREGGGRREPLLVQEGTGLSTFAATCKVDLRQRAAGRVRCEVAADHQHLVVVALERPKAVEVVY